MHVCICLHVCMFMNSRGGVASMKQLFVECELGGFKGTLLCPFRYSPPFLPPRVSSPPLSFCAVFPRSCGAKKNKNKIKAFLYFFLLLSKWYSESILHVLVCSWKFANQFAVFNILCIFLNFQVPVGPAAGHPTGEKNLIAGLFSVCFLWLTERLDFWMLSWLARLWDWLTCRSTLPASEPADGPYFSRVVTHSSANSTPPASPTYYLIDLTDGQWSFQRISVSFFSCLFLLKVL